MSIELVENIPFRLKEELAACDYSMAAASRAVGETSPQRLKDVISGRQKCPAELISKLSEIGIDVVYVLTGRPWLARTFARLQEATAGDAAKKQDWTVADQLRWQEERGIHIPHEPTLTPDEELLLTTYRGMTPAKRKALLNLLAGK